MNFEIKLHPDAVKFLIDLSSETKERLTSGIRSLGADPFKSRSYADIKKLKGTKKRDDLYPELRFGSLQSFSTRIALREYAVLFPRFARSRGRIFGEET